LSETVASGEPMQPAENGSRRCSPLLNAEKADGSSVLLKLTAFKKVTAENSLQHVAISGHP